MKGIKVRFFCITVWLTLLCAGIAVPVSAQSAAPADDRDAAGMDLDAAIREAAAQMGENLPGGTKVALVSVASSSARLSEYVISRLEAALVGGKKLVVVDRANLDKVREEQGFQASGEVDDDSAKSIGKLLGVGAIVTGAFADLGDVYSLTLKAINIETATVAVSYPADITKSTRIETLLASGGGAASPGGSAARSSAQTAASAAAVPVQASAPEPAAPVYNVGDTGPAGGIIFYDKGNSSGGWQYLEAAPSDLGKAQWQSDSRDVSGTKDTIGSGKQNTQLIAESGRAALLCQQYSLGGYRDWFLPSKSELDLMHINLKMKDLGNFSDDWYWSSSQSDGGYSAWGQRFSDGLQDGSYNYSQGRGVKGHVYNVRACRQF
jgi:hypothetical protein